MSPFLRWRIALPLAVLSVLLLGATIVGAVAFWNGDSTPRRLVTVFLGLMFAGSLGISLSIGFDRKLTGAPWLRIGTVIVFIALGCGVSWVRDML